MAVPSGKTPVSYLHEVSTKRGLTPKYDLISNEGDVHEAVFMMKVAVGDAVTSGKGCSKKKAKHSAAQAMLSSLLGTPDGEPSGDIECKSNNEEVNTDNSSNFVGELQEFTQKKLIAPPYYHFTDCNHEPSHSTEFICSVKVAKFVEKASCRSKKAAKRQAASKMLERIRNASCVVDNAVAEDDDCPEEELPLGFDVKCNGYATRKDRRRRIFKPVLHSVELEVFYEDTMLKSDVKRSPDSSSAINFLQMLHHIAEAQHFEVQFYDITELSVSDMFQTLIKLTRSPIVVCCGTGESVEESHATAAYNALHFLRVMSKT